MSYPNFLSFDFPESFFQTTKEQQPKYPPVNIKADGKGTTVIEMAIAGFSPADISIEEEDNQLTISGKKEQAASSEESTKWNYEVKEISGRSFKRVWTKRSNYVVDSATFENGILTVVLKKNAETVRKIDITTDTTKLLS